VVLDWRAHCLASGSLRLRRHLETKSEMALPPDIYSRRSARNQDKAKLRTTSTEAATATEAESDVLCITSSTKKKQYERKGFRGTSNTLM